MAAEDADGLGDGPAAGVAAGPAAPAGAPLGAARGLAAELVVLLREAVRLGLPEPVRAPLREAAEVLLPLADGEEPPPGGLPARADAALQPLARARAALAAAAGGEGPGRAPGHS